MMHTYSFLLYYSPIGTFNYNLIPTRRNVSFLQHKTIVICFLMSLGGRNVLIKCDKESIKRHQHAFQVQRPLKWMCSAVNPTLLYCKYLLRNSCGLNVKMSFPPPCMLKISGKALNFLRVSTQNLFSHCTEAFRPFEFHSNWREWLKSVFFCDFFVCYR